MSDKMLAVMKKERAPGAELVTVVEDVYLAVIRREGTARAP